MIEKTDNSNFANELSLCLHRTGSGRRCGLPFLIPIPAGKGGNPRPRLPGNISAPSLVSSASVQGGIPL
jgi:hypothetical protein